MRTCQVSFAGRLPRQRDRVDGHGNAIPTQAVATTACGRTGDVEGTQAVSDELALHGVTRAIELQVEGELRDGQLVVVGSTEIVFADYDIAQPVSMSVVSIEDHGTMKFQLVFAPA